MQTIRGLYIIILTIIFFVGCSKINGVEAPVERFFDFHDFTMRLLTGQKQTFELKESMTNYPFSAIRFESLDEGKVMILDERTYSVTCSRYNSGKGNAGK
jgi:PBP1b-binding outer membrane lipoprotein LpoB